MFRGYKTLGVVVTFLIAVLSSDAVQSYMAFYPKSFGSAIAVAVVVLRVFTTTPVFKKYYADEVVDAPSPPCPVCAASNGTVAETPK